MALVSKRITQVSALLLVATLSLGLVIPKIAGFGFLALALLAILWLSWHRAWLDGDLNALERLFVLFILLFVGIWVLAWIGHGLSPAGFDAMGRMLRLLLIIPLFLFMRRADGLDQAWWWGLVMGSLVAGAFAGWFFITGQTATFESRVEGATNPIYFGGIALAMAVMLVAKLNDHDIPKPVVILAILMAFLASLLSGSRGAWLALMPMMALYTMTLGKRQAPIWRFGLPMLAGLGAVVVLFLPGVPTSARFLEGFAELVQLTQGTMTEGALGRRWSMWTLAIESMQHHWWTGIGPGAFADALQAAISSGDASALMAPYRHPHSQYLSALTDGGLFLLCVFVLLLAVAARRFYRLFFSGLQSTRQLGWAGLSAITLLAVMALSESIFERNAGIVWFGLFSASAMGLVHVARRRELEMAQLAKRQQSLSVVIIAKNEADRIERCLASVHGWADEIIVLDSGSVDETVAIAKRYATTIEQTDWPGYGKQKQRALDMATGDWVLSVDADEALSDELKAEISCILNQAANHGTTQEAEFSAYTLPWVTHAFGQTLKHGRWSRTPLRLIQQGAGRFTDALVHEHLALLPGKKSGHLESALHHWPYRDVAHAKEKLAHYATLHAHQRQTTRSHPGFLLIAGLKAAHTWLDNMIFRAALLDGRAGWILSGLLARYTFQKYRPYRSTS